MGGPVVHERMLLLVFVCLFLAVGSVVFLSFMLKAPTDIAGTWAVDVKLTTAWYAETHPDDDAATRAEQLAAYVDRVLTVTDERWTLRREDGSVCEDMACELDRRYARKLELKMIVEPSKNVVGVDARQLHFPEEETWFYLERWTVDGTALRIYYRKVEE